MEQLADPNSALMTNPSATSMQIDAESISFELVSPPSSGMYRRVGTTRCELCGENSIPDQSNVHTCTCICRACVPGRAPDPMTHDTCVCDANFYRSASTSVEPESSERRWWRASLERDRLRCWPLQPHRSAHLAEKWPMRKAYEESL